MKVSLSVLWPRKVPPAIQEVEFSYHFCRTLSREQCLAAFPECVWEEYRGNEELRGFISGLKEDMVLVVSDPEILLSGVAIKRLVKAVLKGHTICGPVYNLTDFPRQVAHMPAPYINMATYLEVADILSRKGDDAYIPTEALDPACIMCAGGVARKLDFSKPIKESTSLIKRETKNGLMVDRGALIHSFGDYYMGERDDLVALVPDTVRHVLDVGCAMGGYGKRLKRTRPDIEITGIEMNPVMARSARRFYKRVLTCRVEEAKFGTRFDLINCGDILEHLQDPWNMLRLFHGLLVDRGYLVLSVPNAGHWSIVKDLLQGRFQYIPVGLLCVTHIRWFTEDTLCRALEKAGFSIDVLKRQQLPPTPKGEDFIREICERGYGNEESLRTNEIIIRAINHHAVSIAP